MKLYEFTMTYNQNFSESEIPKDVEKILSQRSSEEGWAEGYTHKQTQDPESLPSGEKRFHFAVYGELLEDVGDGSTKQKATNHSSADDVAAQPPPEI